MSMTKSIEPKTIGGSLPRIDGPLKVSGHAVYTSDINLPGMLHAVPVCSTVASGKIASIDATKAKGMPGVKGVFYRGNIGPFYRTDPALRPTARVEEKRPPPSKTMSSPTTVSTSGLLWRRPWNRLRRLLIL